VFLDYKEAYMRMTEEGRIGKYWKEGGNKLIEILLESRHLHPETKKIINLCKGQAVP
jgi:hypothetical protein